MLKFVTKPRKYKKSNQFKWTINLELTYITKYCFKKNDKKSKDYFQKILDLLSHRFNGQWPSLNKLQ